MRLALIANPGSGRKLDPGALRRRLEEAGAEVILCEEGWKGDEATRTRARGTDRIVAAGGDGIVGACAALAGELGIPLAVVATGTANDFARHQGLPRDIDAACRLAVQGTERRRLELAAVDGRPFVNAASGGLSPVAAERATPLKPVLGALAYAAGAAGAGLTGAPVALTARVDGHEAFQGEAWQVIVAATGAFGAGADIEEADPQDGLLDLVAVPSGSRLALPRRALAMRRGDLAGQEDVVHVRGDDIVLEVPAGTPFNVDGELVRSRGDSVRFTARQDAYELVVA